MTVVLACYFFSHKKQIYELESNLKLNEKEKEFLEKIQKEDQEKLKLFKDLITNEIENTSNKIFSTNTNQFKDESKVILDQMLTPLKDNLKQFHEKIEKHYKEENQQRYALEKEIKKMTEGGYKLQEEAKQLTQAIKGDSKKQGAWGEVILNRVLNSSGLRENEEYIVQGKGMGLKSSETGNLLKPDVIIRLPNDRHLIIDSKVSLTHYVQLEESKTEEEKDHYLKLFLDSLKKHIKDLSSKEYQYATGVKSISFVFLFFPIESSFSVALQKEPQIFEEAWKQSVIIVSPTNLLAALKTVSFIWQRENESKNVINIAKESGKLYDKFVGFSEDMKKLDHQLNLSRESFDHAWKKLQTGNGNIFSKMESIKKLGARTEKQLDNQ